MDIDGWIGEMDSVMCYEGYKDELAINSGLRGLLSEFIS